MDAKMCLECFHTAGVTGPNPVPPTNSIKDLGQALQPATVAFGTTSVALLTQAFG